MHERDGDSTGRQQHTARLGWMGWFSNEANEAQALRLTEIRTHQWHILQCSAMTGRNLKEGLAWVVEDAKKRLFLY